MHIQEEVHLVQLNQQVLLSRNYTIKICLQLEAGSAPLRVHHEDSKRAHDNIKCICRPGAQILSIGYLESVIIRTHQISIWNMCGQIRVK